MKSIIILAILLSALSSQAQNRLFGNGFFNIRNNKFGWFGTSGTDTVGYVDSLKVKWFKPVMPGFYTTSTAPTASSFTGSIIYNTDSSLHQYSNGSAWVNLPGIGGGGGGGVTSFTDGSGFDGTVTGSALSLTTSLTTGSLTWIGASGALSQNNANLFWDNSNVRLGIGTATPSERLHIYRDADVLALMQFQNPNAGVSAAGGVKFSTNGGDSYIYRTSNAYVSGHGDALIIQEAGGGPIKFLTANEKVTILNGGNVGIGINNPANVLDVLHASQPQLRLTTTATTSYTTLQGVAGNLYIGGSSTTNTLVAIGGSTSSFPALRRNAALLQAYLADGSALTDLEIAGRAYNATTWNGSNRAVSEDAIRDQIETMNVSSGTYTPTLTNTTNVAASSVYGNFYYTRIGNLITVTGVISIDPTAATTQTQLDISLPIASALTNFWQLTGQATANASVNTVEAGAIVGDVTNDRASLVFLTGSFTGAGDYTIRFTYEVL